MGNNKNFILPPLIPRTELAKILRRARHKTALFKYIDNYEKKQNVKVSPLNKVVLVESLLVNNKINKPLNEKKAKLNKNLNNMFTPSTSRPAKKRRTT
jgi:hypothetical protein